MTIYVTYVDISIMEVICG